MCPEPLFAGPAASVAAVEKKSFVAEAVDALLADRSETTGLASVVPRSPLGPHAVRLRPQGASADGTNSRCQDLSDWLGRQAWVAEVVARPPHVYLQACTASLTDWVASGLAARLGDFARTMLQVRGAVRFADPGSSRSRSLERFRDAAVGHSIGALLEAGGWGMAIEHDPQLPPGGVVVVLDADASGTRTVRVEGIDLPQGALRARCGGSASADDVVEMLRRHASLVSEQEIERMFEPADLLRFVLLSCPRMERIPLTDARLQAACRGVAEVLAAQRLAAGEPGGATASSPASAPGSGDRALRDLAQQVDLFEIALARATAELDPCDLVRFVLGVAARMRVAGASLQSSDGLRFTAWRSMEAAIGLAGIHLSALSGAIGQRSDLVTAEP